MLSNELGFGIGMDRCFQQLRQANSAFEKQIKLLLHRSGTNDCGNGKKGECSFRLSNCDFAYTDHTAYCDGDDHDTKVFRTLQQTKI